MGCCQSTNNVSQPTKDPRISNSNCNTIHGGCSKSPPPSHPLLEEEKVKEVLSETSKSQPNHQHPFIRAAPLLPEKNRSSAAAGFKTPPFTALVNDEPSEEFSEICSSLGESVTESREIIGAGNGDSQQLRRKSPARFKNMPLSGDVKRDKIAGRSPGRRPDPSLERVRNGSGDNGESSGRRSKSPVMRTDSEPLKPALSRSQSTRKTGKSPGRIGPRPGERIRKMDEEKEAVDKWPPTSNESLENPLVSLECFIFL